MADDAITYPTKSSTIHFRAAPKTGSRMARMRQRLAEQRARLSLRWRIVLVLFGVLVILLGGLGTMITLTEERALFQNEATALRDQARLAAQMLPRHPITVSSPGGADAPNGAISPDVAIQFAAMIRRLASGNVHASIFSPQGILLMTSEQGFAPQVIPPSALFTTARSDPNKLPPYVIVRADGHRQLVVVQPLVTNTTIIGILVVSTPTEPFDRTVAVTRLALGLGIFVALALAVALTWPLVGAALRPLTQMERTSARIARGDLSLRLEVPRSDDEIGRLSRSFNHMVGELESAFARQQRFIADASHELRTPLTALRGSLEMQLMGAAEADPVAAKRLIRGMYAETRRMQRLVDDLLILSRIDEHRLELRPEPIDVAALIADLVEAGAHLAQGQTIQSSVDPAVPPLIADADRLRQILLNLVSNAVKFTAPTDMIAISAQRDAANNGITFAIRDTGVGISAAALPLVFDRFYRADAARTRQGERIGGSGLGLAIARGLLTAMGGTISLESVEGEGTTVRVWLPISPKV